MKFAYTIYKITNIKNSKCYIGLTLNFTKRMTAHKNNSRSNRSGRLYNSIRKNGIENFIFEPIAYCVDLIEAKKTEQYFVQLFDSYNNGYNMTIGGDSPPTGKDHVFYGKNRQEVMQKMWQGRDRKIKELGYGSRKGQPWSLESRKKASIARLGKSPANKGQKMSNQQLECMNKRIAEKFGIVVFDQNTEITYFFKSLKYASIYLKVSRHTLSNCLNGKSKKFQVYRLNNFLQS